MHKTELSTNSPKFQWLLKKTVVPLKVKHLKRSFCEHFYLLWIQVRIFDFREILAPRVRVLVSSSWFAGFGTFDCAVFCDNFSLSMDQFTVLSTLEFFRKSVIPLNMIETCKNDALRRSRLGPWIKRVFLKVFEGLSSQSPEVSVSGNESPLFECQFSRVQTLLMKRDIDPLFHKTIMEKKVPQKNLEKKVPKKNFGEKSSKKKFWRESSTISAKGTLMSEKQKIGTHFFRFWNSEIFYPKTYRTPTCVTPVSHRTKEWYVCLWKKASVSCFGRACAEASAVQY